MQNLPVQNLRLRPLLRLPRQLQQVRLLPASPPPLPQQQRFPPPSSQSDRASPEATL